MLTQKASVSSPNISHPPRFNHLAWIVRPQLLAYAIQAPFVNDHHSYIHEDVRYRCAGAESAFIPQPALAQFER